MVSPWHEWAVADPSAADLYETNFWIGLSSSVVILGIAWFVFWMAGLRPTTTHRGER